MVPELSYPKAKVARGLHLAEQVVIVDGMPGCGKTMMTPIISAFPRVELVQYSYEIEYAAALRSMGKIDADAATTLIQMFADLQIYNVMMARETNFRWSDLSGVWSNPHWLNYLRRLFQPGDDTAIERISSEHPILHLVTHWMLGVIPHLFEALGDSLRFIVVVRHPLYMIKQQFNYMHRRGTDPRDFSIWFEYEGQSLPWYAFGWEKRFLGANDMDRTIYMIDEHQRLHDRVIARLGEFERERLLIIPFECFVTRPEPFLHRMESLLGVEMNALTERALKKQKIPRAMYADGIDLPIYRENKWEPPERDSSEDTEFKRRRDFAAEHATTEAMEVLDRLVGEYEQRYLRGDGPANKTT